MSLAYRGSESPWDLTARVKTRLKGMQPWLGLHLHLHE
jgi:hypothetical protein